jgi:hypothetical protein
MDVGLAVGGGVLSLRVWDGGIMQICRKKRFSLHSNSLQTTTGFLFELPW